MGHRAFSRGAVVGAGDLVAVPGLLDPVPVWRDRSLWLALAIPAAVHMLQNVGPAILVATGQLA
jgi:hypothetical protein